ncbi:MAG: TerB family tellurite resistance protein [Planctomycetes bacterium]|nr:TerB family tellurite resistance protein [Planctomycetota bacterium]
MPERGQPGHRGRSLDLARTGWLGRLLDAYVEAHDPAEDDRAATEVLCAHPRDGRLDQAQRLADRRLARLRAGGGLGARAPGLPPALAARAGDDAAVPHLARAALVVVGWDVLMAVAALHGNRSGPEERKLELLAVMATSIEDLALARRLHDAHLELSARARGLASIEGPAAAIERRLEQRDRRREAALDHPAGHALLRLELRALAALGSLYFERATIEEDGIARLHALSRAQKVDLIGVLVALAWADGKVTPEERRLIEHHVTLAGLPPATARRLLAGLDRPADESALELEPLEPGPRRFILEQAILISLVDDDLDQAEQALLERLAARLGASPLELEQVMVEVTAFYEKNREAVHDFGPVSGAFGRLRELVVERAQRAVLGNTRRLMQEIRETGELARLLGAASVRPLTAEEAAKVRTQLLDICKSIPALAIFALPGGALLLPILLRVLPFNILPTAFAADEGASREG